jgi:hypothetical protein
VDGPALDSVKLEHKRLVVHADRLKNAASILFQISAPKMNEMSENLMHQGVKVRIKRNLVVVIFE